MTRDQMILRRQQLRAELKHLDEELRTCHNCVYCGSRDYCTKFKVKLDADALLLGPKECPEFDLDDIPF
jgi:transcription elongation factor Elf1